jgi:broad specificity phosphatase PhoE
MTTKNKTLSITLIRHGDTDYNQDLSQLYVTNIPLNETGIEKSSHLQGTYDVVYVSPLLRTQMTLQYSKIKTTKLIMDDRIREQRGYPCDILQNEVLSKEDDDQLMRRCYSFLFSLKNSHETNICVITHSNWIKMFFTINNNHNHVQHPENCGEYHLTIPFKKIN